MEGLASRLDTTSACALNKARTWDLRIKRTR